MLASSKNNETRPPSHALQPPCRKPGPPIEVVHRGLQAGHQDKRDLAPCLQLFVHHGDHVHAMVLLFDQHLRERVLLALLKKEG